MKSLSVVLGTSLLALAAGIASPVQAQSTAPGATASASAADMAEAEVRKIDKENRKITLKHGPIKNLDMPPMTMVFQVADAAMLDKVKAGDKVRFKASDVGGKITVTDIQPAP